MQVNGDNTSGVRTDIEVRDAGGKGKGVFALRSFKRGEFIFRRRHGRVVSTAEVPTLTEEERRHLCELDRERSAVLLPPGSYLNHSSEPNAMRSGSGHFGIFDAADGDRVEIFGPGAPSGPGQLDTNTVVAGFLVDDLDSATREIVAGGAELLGTRNDAAHSSWQHFRAPDGNVYELKEVRP